MSAIMNEHQLRIARKTLKMNDVMVNVMGGMTKSQARELLANNVKCKNEQDALKYAQKEAYYENDPR